MIERCVTHAHYGAALSLSSRREHTRRYMRARASAHVWCLATESYNEHSEYASILIKNRILSTTHNYIYIYTLRVTWSTSSCRAPRESTTRLGRVNVQDQRAHCEITHIKPSSSTSEPPNDIYVLCPHRNTPASRSRFIPFARARAYTMYISILYIYDRSDSLLPTYRTRARVLSISISTSTLSHNLIL